MSIVSGGSGGRRSLRPYQHPPYKNTKSYYERRMRELRNIMNERAISMTSRLRALDPSDPALPAMCHEMTVHGNAGKFLWINRALDELKALSAELQPGVTRERVEGVVIIRDNMANALADWDEHKNAHQRVVEKPSTLPEEQSYEDEEGKHKGPPPPTKEQMEHANIVRNCLADLIQALSKPFWPRPVPAAAKGISLYGRGDPKPTNATPAPDKSRAGTRNATTPADAKPKKEGSSQPAERSPTENPSSVQKSPSAAPSTEKASHVVQKASSLNRQPAGPAASSQVDAKSDEALIPEKNE
ncbi:hypothetical protein RvY_06021 [Ramazzottius varieornatus]|uniref:Uncharacterized protein n=1 Tax=Ramazzottius varieornatus TaxID=947166 RepID=A0A1D1UX24_RAMVA|nr:hypothetical protein RvY_06021 [Ramazzottius varieornatus]